eukprot:Hpha_TRINITY_DN16467_c4_g4::TRINITY_DN16467_c4_g4_i1::g.160855::m.160855
MHGKGTRPKGRSAELEAEDVDEVMVVQIVMLPPVLVCAGAGLVGRGAPYPQLTPRDVHRTAHLLFTGEEVRLAAAVPRVPRLVDHLADQEGCHDATPLSGVLQHILHRRGLQRQRRHNQNKVGPWPRMMTVCEGAHHTAQHAHPLPEALLVLRTGRRLPPCLLLGGDVRWVGDDEVAIPSHVPREKLNRVHRAGLHHYRPPPALLLRRREAPGLRILLGVGVNVHQVHLQLGVDRAGALESGVLADEGGTTPHIHRPGELHIAGEEALQPRTRKHGVDAWGHEVSARLPLEHHTDTVVVEVAVLVRLDRKALWPQVGGRHRHRVPRPHATFVTLTVGLHPLAHPPPFVDRVETAQVTAR